MLHVSREEITRLKKIKILQQRKRRLTKEDETAPEIIRHMDQKLISEEDMAVFTTAFSPDVQQLLNREEYTTNAQLLFVAQGGTTVAVTAWSLRRLEETGKRSSRRRQSSRSGIGGPEKVALGDTAFTSSRLASLFSEGGSDSFADEPASVVEVSQPSTSQGSAVEKRLNVKTARLSTARSQEVKLFFEEMERFQKLKEEQKAAREEERRRRHEEKKEYREELRQEKAQRHEQKVELLKRLLGLPEVNE
ncbi:hypothetical protein HPB49_006813 [Dermacentor silvarum]|uniref:Uncharacterized protein n=1 Tax=Dermacentor silvarum TaxID=543639 RepID=A0ACB8CDU3_DERSI|nr:hypothetical protein HPB49_006813 [Dermacentor silvarum]